jgi:5-methylcytosine-specific restriction protein B
VVAELDERFNSQPDMSRDTFQVKLKRQLAEASPIVSKLAAEMLWVMNLFPSNIGPDAKQAAVRSAWSWSGEELPQYHPMLDRELLSGLGSAGPAFLAHRSAGPDRTRLWSDFRGHWWPVYCCQKANEMINKIRDMIESC